MEIKEADGVIFEGSIGDGWTSDMALDDIVISPGPCSQGIMLSILLASKLGAHQM